MVRIRIQVVDAHIVVTTLSKKTNKSVTYESLEGLKRHSYYVSGSWNNWGYEEMMIDEKKPGVFTHQVTVGEACQEIFAVPGTCIARGPGRPPNGPDGAYWSVISLRP